MNLQAPGTTLDLVYFDTKLGFDGMAFGCTIIPSTYLTPQLYDWKQHGVKLFVVDDLQEFDEVHQFQKGFHYLLCPPGQPLLVRIPTGAHYEDKMFTMRSAQAIPNVILD